MPADLHIHSDLSDGTEAPEEIVRQAKSAGLSVISLTDHDGVDGIDRALNEGQRQGVDVIPGIELTSEDKGREIHILGYFIDHRSRELLELLEKIQKSRRERIYKMVRKLRKLKIEIRAEDVFDLSGAKSPGRPHVARLLIKQGYVSNFKEAFNKYLDLRGPAYVSHYRMSPLKAIQAIRQAKGLPVFGHPAVSKCDELLPDMVAAGLAGIEAQYLGHSPEQTRHYEGLAKKFGILTTGGSDYHGENSGREIKLGEFSIADELVEKLKDEHLRGN